MASVFTKKVPPAQEPPADCSCDQIPEYTGFTTIPDTSTKTLIEVLKLDKTINTEAGHDAIDCFCVSADASRLFTVGYTTECPKKRSCCSCTTAEAKYSIKVWDVATGAILQTMDGQADLRCVSADGSCCFSGTSDNTIKVWDVATGACLQTLEGHAKSVYPVCVSADGSRCFSGDLNGVIKVWDVATGTCVQTLEGHDCSVMSVCVSAGGHLFSGGEDHTIKQWDTDTGTCAQTMEAWENMECNPHATSGHTNDVASVCVSADGSRCISGSSDNTIKVWDVATGACIQTLGMHKPYSHIKGCASPVFLVYVSADGSTCFSVSGPNTVKVWDVATGTCVQTLEGNGNSGSVCVSADQSKLFSQTDEKTITIWSITEPREISPRGLVPGGVVHWESTWDELCFAAISPYTEPTSKSRVVYGIYKLWAAKK